MGRLPHDGQSQRARGLDVSGRALCMFRGTIAGDGSQAGDGAAASKSESATSGKSAKARLATLEENATRIANPARRRSKSAETEKAAERTLPMHVDRRPARDPGIGRQRQCATDFRRCAPAGSARGDVGESQHDPAGGGRQAGRRPASSRGRGGRPRSAQRCRSGPAAEPRRQRRPLRWPGQAGAARRAGLASSNDSAWDQTSLIGKIFIAFGALLTMASAARMFMA